MNIFPPQKSVQTTDKEIEEMIQLNELIAGLGKIDLPKFEKEVEAAKTPIEKTIEALSKNEKLLRRKKARPKMHWKTKRRKKREHYQKVVKPRSARMMAEAMRVGGWFPLIRAGWDRHQTPYSLTQEEWDEHIADLVGGVSPDLSRLDKGKPWTLENLLVRDGDTGSVLFDGSEYSLRLMGYII